MSTPRGYTAFPSSADLFYICTTSSTSEEELTLHYAPPSQSSLKIGVLVLGQEPVQLLDLAVVDLLAKISRSRLDRLNATSNVLDEAVDELDIRYVSESGEGSFAITSGARMPVTGEKNSFENAPAFDIIIVPGSFTTGDLSVAAKAFVTAQASNPDITAILSIASGILSLSQTGLLNYRRATGPVSLLPSLRQRFPETMWQDSPWARQDKFWSSTSAISALDMVAAWMREYFWDRREAVECALAAAGVAPLDDYEE